MTDRFNLTVEAESEDMNASWIRQVVFVEGGYFLPVREKVSAEAHFGFGHVAPVNLEVLADVVA